MVRKVEEGRFFLRFVATRWEEVIKSYDELLEPLDESGLIKYWGLLRRGLYDEVLEKCTEFLEASIDPISPHAGEFLFLRAYAETMVGKSIFPSSIPPSRWTVRPIR